MKKLVSFLLVLCLILALGANMAFAEPGTPGAPAVNAPFAQELEAKYTDPDRVYGTEVRWWLGEASHTVETLMDEIQAMYDGGFRGVELCMQSDGDNATNEIYAYGSAEWAYKWKLLMNKCLDLGMTVSLTSGTHWATANLPYNPNTGEGLNPDSQAASRAIAMSTSTVSAGANLATLTQPNSRRPAGAEFLGAYAYRIVSGNNVDPGSGIELTGITQGATAYDQALNWTAPDDGDYRVFAYWSQGTAQTASPAQYQCYAINYFDERGFNALKEFWADHYLDDPELNAKILAGDVQLFFDSIELNATGGITYWTEDLPEEFLARKGYDIMPYMFLLSGTGMHLVLQSLGTYRLDGEEVRNRQIQNDFLEVLTDLQMERTFGPFRKWLNSVGIKTRYQPSYGRTFEISEPIMYVDYVETESLNGYNQVDFYRVHAGGAKLQNKVFSNETSAVPRFSFSNQYHLRDAYSFYAAGGQRTIWHVWGADYNRPAATANNWLSNDGAMNTFFRFGKRNPAARDYDEFNAHLGRAQQLMQTGKARSDVGFIHNNWNANTSYPAGITVGSNSQLTHVGRTYRSTELQNNGYTYEYFSPEFLFADDVYFDEETKTIEGAGYKALVLYQPYLDVQGARRILDWAQKGLKVVILDDAASHSMFSTGTDEELAEIIAELRELDTVRQATTADYVPLITIGTTASPAAGGYDDNVYEMLLELGVRPYAEYIEPNHQLLTQTRIDDEGNMYLYAYNYCPNNAHHLSRDIRIHDLDHGTNIKTEIKMDGQFIPYAIDAWSGKVTQLANYRYEEGRTVFPIDLDYDNIALFAFEAMEDEKIHIVSTDADAAYAAGDALVVRATKTGRYHTVLSDGASYTEFMEVPEAYDITGWDLTVKSWYAGANALFRNEPRLDGGGTTTDQKWATTTTDISAQFHTMTTWDNVIGVGRDHSGLGRYEANFHWDASAADGAYLDFGDTFAGSMKVWINGQKVGGDITTNLTKAKRSVGVAIDGSIPEGKDLYTGGISWTKPVADISEYLVDGENEIVIEYSSDLTNRMRQRGVVTATQIRTIGGDWWNYFSDYRAYGPSQAVIVPFVEASVLTNVGVTAGERTPLRDKVEYTVAARDMKTVNLVELTFAVDGGILTGDKAVASGLNGFEVFNGPDWENMADNQWEVSYVLGVYAGETRSGSMDIGKLGLDAVKLGDARVTLTDVTVYGIDIVDGAAQSNRRAAAISPVSAVTKVTSVYDVDGDSAVDLADLSLAFYYYQSRSGGANWASARAADVNGDGIVDMLDLVAIYANFIA